MALAVFYVRSLLVRYEEKQPERQVETAVESLKESASAGTLFSVYQNSSGQTGAISGGKFETKDIKTAFSDAIASGELEYSLSLDKHEDDELIYYVQSKGYKYAKITLKATSEPETKLLVFTFRDWTVGSVELLLEAHDYTLTVPAGINAAVNGIALGESEVTSSDDETVTYTLDDIYLEPDVLITDSEGNRATYVIKNDAIVPEIYNYSLTIPSVLEVRLNGAKIEGTDKGEGISYYSILRLNETSVEISDQFGNTIQYEGGNSIPLTYLRAMTPEGYTVKLDGEDITSKVSSYEVNDEFYLIKDIVEDLPKNLLLYVAVLRDDAAITLCDSDGTAVQYDSEKHNIDLTSASYEDTVPWEITAEIDPLEVLEQWSLFTSNDVSFAQVAHYLYPDSYQYEMADEYANGIDITFTSVHSLGDPPFINESVKNYRRISDNCFSVDVSFTKIMIVAGSTLEDSMDERVYFVRYGEGYGQQWKLAAMKENV